MKRDANGNPIQNPLDGIPGTTWNQGITPIPLDVLRRLGERMRQDVQPIDFRIPEAYRHLASEDNSDE